MIRSINVNDVWLVRLTDAQGHEQLGTRPAIVLAVHIPANLVMVTPFTSNLDAQRFPFTHRVAPTTTNGLTQASITQIYQTRSLTVQRFIRKIGVIDDEDIEAIKLLLKTYCALDD